MDVDEAESGMGRLNKVEIQIGQAQTKIEYMERSVWDFKKDIKDIDKKLDRMQYRLGFILGSLSLVIQVFFKLWN